MMKVVAMVAVVMVAACQGLPGDEVYYEHECSAQGGICAKVEFCPKDGKMTDGLCPKQQADGVECCQKLPTNLVTCKQRGGECVPTEDCPSVTNDAECPSGQICCIWLT
ncbi:U-scoloptoxin(19)-Sm1a-like [Portunus trituberculatus]|uniref:U-scoloptoxin(19)-Sm1a-like n=1 Tax=Portunus trituberculatus TaxID=210409 RepID=UPI001E1CE227|nr:U-scoloptoxin(19)-Sm1a-like [Portunus trituberculatus]